MRNPIWVRDEIILALDLYFRAGRKQLAAEHPDVIALSRLLNTLPIHPAHQRDESFRNPNGISMILGNFLGIAPMHAQPGLSRNNHLQAEVWQDFVDSGERLATTAAAIAQCVSLLDEESDASAEADEGFPEGRLLAKLHLMRERSRTLVEQKKSQALTECGKLECEACGFDFFAFYGDLGLGFAECHHIVPLAEGPPARRTQLRDLAIVCANCHRVIHRAGCALSVAALRNHLSNRRARCGFIAAENYAASDLS